jgi:hypothetical protein
MIDYEEFGTVIDELENLSAGLSIPLPAEMHIEQLKKLLPEKVEKLKKIFLQITGENPWE